MMSIDKEFWTTLAITVINILVLYFILKKILFKPVNKFMSNRTSKIEEALKKAELAEKKLETLEQENQKKLKEIKKEGAVLLDSYQKKAQEEYDKIIDKAKQDSKIIIENTKNELNTEKEQLVNQLKEEVTQLVLETSKKVLDKNIDDNENRKFIEEILKDK